MSSHLDHQSAGPPRHVRRDPAVVIATGFGFGFAPVAPGTVGALWGLPLAWAVGQIGDIGPVNAVWIQIAVIVVLFGVGVPLCTAAAQRLGGEKDPGAIVFDEIASLPITFFLVPWSELGGWALAVTLAVGFGLHRLFDITKPPPCRQAERLRDGLGIMADDTIAGIYSCAVLHGCLWVGRFLSA
jgi:phosphatidylglycerophosphatase A